MEITQPEALQHGQIIGAMIARIREGMEDIQRCIESIASAFSELKKIHTTSIKTIEFLSGEFPGVDSNFWRNIDMVSSGDLHPVVVSSGCVGIRELRKLPLKVQQEAVTIGVPVHVGGDDFRMVPAHLLTAQEIKATITPGGSIRTISEQSKYRQEQQDKARKQHEEYQKSIVTMQAQNVDEEGEVSDIKFRVIGNNVHILECPLTLTLNDLQRIMRLIKK